MLFLSHCYQRSFPLWKSQPTSPPQDALHHFTGLRTCCGSSPDSNLVLLLCILASNVHNYQNQCMCVCVCVCVWKLSMSFYIFHMHKVYIADHMNLICSLYSWWEAFGKVFFLSHTAPGFQQWTYFHLCMWVVHWGLHLRLSWRTWVFPSKYLLWR